MLRVASLSLALAWAGAASAQTADKLAESALAKLAAQIAPKADAPKPVAKITAKPTPNTAPAQTIAKVSGPASTAKAATPAAAKPGAQAIANGATPAAATAAAKPPVKTAAKKAPAKKKAKTVEEMAIDGQVSLTLAALTDWIIATEDNRKLPFAVIDKTTAQILIFGADGKLKGLAPILIGAAAGDDSAEGVGDRELKDIPLEEQTTPAGRYVAGFGPATGGKKVLWIDYSTAISIHPVLTTAAAKAEKRTQRLASKESDDNRITHGCINVASSFYTNTVRTTFKKGGVFYILPDTISLFEAFPAYEPAGAVASSGVDVDIAGAGAQSALE